MIHGYSCGCIVNVPFCETHVPDSSKNAFRGSVTGKEHQDSSLLCFLVCYKKLCNHRQVTEVSNNNDKITHQVVLRMKELICMEVSWRCWVVIFSFIHNIVLQLFSNYSFKILLQIDQSPAIKYKRLNLYITPSFPLHPDKWTVTNNMDFQYHFHFNGQTTFWRVHCLTHRFSFKET